MELRLIVLGITLLALTASSSTVDKTASKRLQPSHRRVSSRSVAPATPIRPPLRVTNAHTGLAPETSQLPSRNELPPFPVTRRKRIMRRRLSPKRNPNLARKRQAIAKAAPAQEKGKYRMARKIVEGVLRNTQGGAQLVSASAGYSNIAPYAGNLTLPANATKIRPTITDNFSCQGRRYGYYADQENDCQIFHVCVVLKQIFPDTFTDEDTIKFSFICPEHTIFTQDAMVCAWPRDAVPCKDAHLLYHMNQNFFVVASNDINKQPPTGSYGTPVSPQGDSTGSYGTPVSPQGGSKPGPLPNSSQLADDKKQGPLPNSSPIEKEKAPLPNSSKIN